jgi:16S rRNA pseudouridine516 synthase
MHLNQLLFSQGFGTRRECDALIVSGRVRIGDQVRDDPLESFEPLGLRFSVNGVEWPYRERALIVLHKPAGYECSRKPRHHPSVYSLLPAPLRARDVQAVGRLDADTTGALLLTDDGALIHRLTSPKHHVAKVYEVTCKHAVDADQAARLCAGVVLLDDPLPVRAAACVITGSHTLRLTLLEGKYHQVKRMLAAVSNRVEALHRSSFGDWLLPADLAAGAWRWLDEPVPAAPIPAAP